MTIKVHATPASLLLFTARTERLAACGQRRERLRRAGPPSSPRFACPTCTGPTDRVARTVLDRLIAVLVLLRVRRHRCRSPACGWTGNLDTRPNRSLKARARGTAPVPSSPR